MFPRRRRLPHGATLHEPRPLTYTELDARNVKPPARFEVKAPAGAPNILIILLDDMGFGVPSSFGGPAQMPTLERLADTGLRYNNFHTTALCAPTRTALLSGHNHHMNNMGSITETATAFPGYTGVTPLNLAPISNILRLNGYSTGQFGRITKRRLGKLLPPAQLTVGRPERVSTSSTGSSAEKPTSGHR
jgi:arylsulfatase